MTLHSWIPSRVLFLSKNLFRACSEKEFSIRFWISWNSIRIRNKLQRFIFRCLLSFQTIELNERIGQFVIRINHSSSRFIRFLFHCSYIVIFLKFFLESLNSSEYTHRDAKRNTTILHFESEGNVYMKSHGFEVWSFATIFSFLPRKTPRGYGNCWRGTRDLVEIVE